MGVGTMGMGRRPGRLIVDMTYGFVDSTFSLGRGETGWPAGAAIRRLVHRAGSPRPPIFYTPARRAGDAPRVGPLERRRPP